MPQPNESQPSAVEGLLVRYYAVYPNGRRCRVSMQDAVSFADKWKNEFDVRVITRLERTPYPVIGTLEQG